MYFVSVIPKRGRPYLAPSKDKCEGYRLKREAMALAEEKSRDDSVSACCVSDDVTVGARWDITYRDGKRVKP